MKKRKFLVSKTEKSSPLGVWLSDKLRIDSMKASQLISVGAVYVNSRRCRDGQARLSPGASVMVVLQESGVPSLERAANLQTLETLYEDSAIVAVNKPAGIPTQPTPSGRQQSLLEVVSSRYPLPRSGLIHRLDRDTSGVVVFARTPAAARALGEEFRQGRVKKHYLAVVTAEIPDSGAIDLPISNDPSRLGRRRAIRSADGATAATNYRVLHRSREFSVVELEPLTGRTHQIRVHLNAIGAPILGDKLYGGAASVAALGVDRCLLHARSLEFIHPLSGDRFRLEAPIPNDMKPFLTFLLDRAQ